MTTQKKGALGRFIMGSLTIMVAVTLLLLYSGNKILEAAGPASQDQKCKLSIAASSIKYEFGFLVKTVTFFASPFGIDCPTNFIAINDKRIFKSVNDEKISLSYNRDDKLKKLVMDEMASCWNKFGASGARIQDATIDGDETDENKVACFTCAQIKTGSGDEGDEFTTTPLDNMYRYAAQTSYGEQSYASFMTNGAQVDQVLLAAQDQKTMLLPNHKYYVVFTIKEINSKTWGGLWHGSSLPEVGTGVANCKTFEGDRSGDVGNNDKVRNAVGCNDENNDLLSFGVIAGGAPPSGITTAKLTGLQNRYPSTVRFVSEEDVFGSSAQCERLF